MSISLAQASIDTTTGLLRGQKTGFTARRWTAIEDELVNMNYALERARRVNYERRPSSMTTNPAGRCLRWRRPLARRPVNG